MYWADYLSDTEDLTTEQHGAYLLLIAYYWKYGQLPPTRVAAEKVTKLSRHSYGKCWRAISRFFTSDMQHRRIDKELIKFETLSTKRKLAGMRGASQRWQLPMPNAIARPAKNPMAIAGNTSQSKYSILNSEPREKPMLPDHELKPTPELLKILERQNRERGIAPARSATALPAGAPPSPVTAKANGKAPHRTSKEELEAIYATRKPKEAEVPFD